MKKYSSLTLREMSDSGQALVLLLLVVALITAGGLWVWLAVAALVVNMACPRAYRPFAYVWLNFSHALGIVVSHSIMTVIYCLLVVPVGLLRRIIGKDAMAFKKWHKGQDSVFVERNHAFVPDDLRKPY